MAESKKGQSAAAKKRAAETRLLKGIKVPGMFVGKGKQISVPKDKPEPEPAANGKE
jgi:hypothetical protein